MMKQIDNYVNDYQKTHSHTPIGPRGSRNWTFEYYENDQSDLKTVLIGPDSHGKIPVWIKNLCHDAKIVRRGGTTYRWSAWSVED